MTDADRELLTNVAHWLEGLTFNSPTPLAGALRRLLAELDVVTADRDALQRLVVEQAKEE